MEGVKRRRLAISTHSLLRGEKRSFSSQLFSYLLRFTPWGADTVWLLVIFVVDNGFRYEAEEARLLFGGRFLLLFDLAEDVEQRFQFRHYTWLLLKSV